MSNEENNIEPENQQTDISENDLPDMENQQDLSGDDVQEIAQQQEDSELFADSEEIQKVQPAVPDEDELNDFENPENMITVRPVKFQKIELTEPNRSIKRNLDIMQDVSMHISVELGRAISTIKDVMDLTTGSIVELDKIAGEQVEIYANNKLVAKGEVIVIEDKFGVRVTSTNIPKTI